TDRNMVRGPLYKQFDLERKNARQAEARLSLSLQRLEDICLYHMKSLAREQRQLQKELQRLQQADITKKKFSSYLSSGIQTRPKDVLTSSPQSRQRHVVSEPKMRALATNMTQEIKAKTQVPPLHAADIKDPMRNQEHLGFQNDRTGCFTEENPQAQEKESANPPEGTDPTQDISVPCYSQEVSTNTEDGPTSSLAGKCGSASADETGSKDVDLKPSGDAGEQNLPSSVECSGGFKGESTKLTFLELFEKAKNAHYLRHRVPPESERLLSIGEIFGHGDFSLPRAGQL
uniref:Coiled-coil domain containing 190 n=1 Tax=Nannospalax galili TaxID=1026970 RepID=A0A8C6W1D0_NANGA